MVYPNPTKVNWKLSEIGGTLDERLELFDRLQK